jgi:predicted RNA binding protein YcfA (HicA-like mRNA interferase family)
LLLSREVEAVPRLMRSSARQASIQTIIAKPAVANYLRSSATNPEGREVVTRDFSGYEVAKVLANKGDFKWVRTTGDHAILRWTHPDGSDVERRTVSIPLHDRVQIGTLRGVAEDAGAKDFDKFCRWIDRNR